MAKYRRRPVEVDAVLWTGREDIRGVVGIGCVHCWPRACINYPHREYGPNYHHGEITTREGTATISRGDYLITGAKGKRFPCKADIFHATYEPVEEAQP